MLKVLNKPIHFPVSCLHLLSLLKKLPWQELRLNLAYQYRLTFSYVLQSREGLVVATMYRFYIDPDNKEKINSNDDNGADLWEEIFCCFFGEKPDVSISQPESWRPGISDRRWNILIRQMKAQDAQRRVLELLKP